jgi:8-oxo-dGTP pyrophosphatase MutT (NUDIX family)
MTRPAERHSVSFAVFSRDEMERVLLVLRPADDADLPNVWGLPAASVLPGETAEEAVVRAGREKLGVTVTPVRVLREGAIDRRDYTLRMKLFEATIDDGMPSVPQPFPNVTQYAGVRWGSAAELEPAAQLGSLCCRLFLEWAT